MAGVYALLSFVLSVGSCLAGGHIARVFLTQPHQKQPENGNPFGK